SSSRRSSALRTDSGRRVMRKVHSRPRSPCRATGLGRHWHFLADFAWLLTDLVYVVMLFVTPKWQRLIPASWQIVPDASHAMLRYIACALWKHREHITHYNS